MARHAYISVAIQVLRRQRGLTTEQLVADLRDYGYEASPARLEAPAEIEQSIIPRDGGPLLKALTRSLDLTHRELDMLINLWALAVLTDEMGEDLALQSLRQQLITALMPA